MGSDDHNNSITTPDDTDNDLNNPPVPISGSSSSSTNEQIRFDELHSSISTLKLLSNDSLDDSTSTASTTNYYLRSKCHNDHCTADHTDGEHLNHQHSSDQHTQDDHDDPRPHDQEQQVEVHRSKRRKKSQKSSIDTITTGDNQSNIDQEETSESIASTSTTTIRLSESEDDNIDDNKDSVAESKPKKLKLIKDSEYFEDKQSTHQESDSERFKDNFKTPIKQKNLKKSLKSKIKQNKLKFGQKIRIESDNNYNPNNNQNNNNSRRRRRKLKNKASKLSKPVSALLSSSSETKLTAAVATTSATITTVAAAAANASANYNQKSISTALISRNSQNNNIHDHELIENNNNHSNSKPITSKIDEEIHLRYRKYLNLEKHLKDQHKTDYTYAHSYSYSPLVSFSDWYRWQIPNMSRPSVKQHGFNNLTSNNHNNNNNTISTDILKSNMVQRHFVGNVPISTIKPPHQQSSTFSTTTTIRRVETTYSSAAGGKNNDETMLIQQSTQNIVDPIYHSTPVKMINFNDQTLTKSSTQPLNMNKLTTQRSSNVEFSDDDDDDVAGGDMINEQFNQQQQHVTNLRSKPAPVISNDNEMTISKRIVKHVKRSYDPTVVTSAKSTSNLGQFSEEDDNYNTDDDYMDDDIDDDQEVESNELTFLRKIRRFFNTTISYVPFIGTVLNDPSKIHMDKFNQTYTTTTTNNDKSNWFSFNHRPKRSYNQYYNSNNDNLNNDGGGGGGRLGLFDSSKFVRICTPSFCIKLFLGLFLTLFLLPLIINYLFIVDSGPSSSSSLYNIPHLIQAIDIPTPSLSSLYTSFLNVFSSLLIWPSFLSLNSLPKLPSLFSSSHQPSLSSSSSSSYSASLDNPHVFDRSVFDAEISSLRNELVLLKEMNQRQFASVLDAKNSSANPPSPSSRIPDPQLVERIKELEAQLFTCCNDRWSNQTLETFRQQIENEFLKSMDSKLSELKQTYDAQLRSQINDVHSNILKLIDDYRDRIDMNLSSVMDEIRAELLSYQEQLAKSQKYDLNDSNSLSSSAANSDDVHRLIRSALAKYDADKTGEADFALESSGGYIMKTRCSESYELSWGTYKLFGMTIWRSINSPRVVIQSGVVPGECWCFAGSEGRIGIHLSARIIPTAFTYEHIPVALSRDGHIKSAPNRIIVYGLRHEDDLDPIALGEYYYRIDNDQPLQRFAVQNVDAAKHSFDMIELNVKSNHGHPDYTCLYRFRVHGQHPSNV